MGIFWNDHSNLFFYIYKKQVFHWSSNRVNVTSDKQHHITYYTKPLFSENWAKTQSQCVKSYKRTEVSRLLKQGLSLRVSWWWHAQNLRNLRIFPFLWIWWTTVIPSPTLLLEDSLFDALFFYISNGVITRLPAHLIKSSDVQLRFFSS